MNRTNAVLVLLLLGAAPPARSQELSEAYDSASKASKAERERSDRRDRAGDLLQAMVDHIVRTGDVKLPGLQSSTVKVKIINRPETPTPVGMCHDPTTRERMYLCASADFLASLLNDDELAFFIAHEIAHIELGHPQGMAYGLFRNASKARNQVSRAGEVRFGTGEQEKAQINRGWEFEADLLGSKLSALAGYRPNAAIEYFEHDVLIHGNTPWNTYGSHPTHKDRIDRLRAAKFPEATTRPLHILDQLKGLLEEKR